MFGSLLNTFVSQSSVKRLRAASSSSSGEGSSSLMLLRLGCLNNFLLIWFSSMRKVLAKPELEFPGVFATNNSPLALEGAPDADFLLQFSSIVFD